eukprot:TRINITY_DN26443_c0_g1_i1.p1 TRINITY_DN26443_c0_g1~~TRINITY_DN26443_c0_g1_i1.p1  ORF type:complete len:466 (+),score=63.37 TRINITY_DN26443_c0_g1_i1:78-1475(+)
MMSTASSCNENLTAVASSDLAKQECQMLPAQKTIELNCLQDMTDTQVAWTFNFYIFAGGYASCLGTASFAFDLATVLNHRAFLVGVGSLMFAIVFVSFFAGVVVDRHGPRKSSMYAALLMSVYFVGQSTAIMVGNDSVWQWPLFIAGALACGCAVALLGAALGPWIDQTADIMCKEDASLSPSFIRSQLLANHTIINAAISIVSMLVGTVCLEVLEMPVERLTFIYSAGCIVAARMMSMCREMPVTAASAKRSLTSDLQSLGDFYEEPRAWLLGFAPLSLGALSFWRRGTVSAAATATLGAGGVASLNLIQKLATMVFAKLTAVWLTRFSGYPVLVLGSFSTIAAVLFFFARDIAEDGWWMSVFFVLTGIARASYETATRSKVLEHFRGEQAAYAFAALTLEQFLVKALFYPTSDIPNADNVQAVVVVVLACLIVPGSLLADRLLARSQRGSLANEAFGDENCRV